MPGGGQRSKWAAAGRRTPPASRGRGWRLCVAGLGALLVTGCKVVIVVPEGGRVNSLQGTECLAGETCVIDVSDTSFADTFEALAAEGYVFERWRAGNGKLCGNATGACSLSTAGFAGIAELEAILAGDSEVFLEPEFSAADDRYDVGAWSELLGGLNTSAWRSDAFLYQNMPNVDNCDPGTLTRAAKDRFLYALNLLRRLHYLPPVAFDDFYSAEAQQSALVQEANNYLTHYPAPSDACYTAAAASGAGSSNLSWRSYQADPAVFPLGWANDNHNIAAMMEAGHRRWVLYPSLGHTSFGQVEGVGSMKVFGFTQPPENAVDPALEYVAYPYREFPYVLVEKGSRPTPWSISMLPPPGMSGNFNHFSGASVTVRETATGTPLDVHSVHYDNRGYGVANFFSWMVTDWEYDTPYTVTINNVRMHDNSTRDIEYPVEIDYAELQ